MPCASNPGHLFPFYNRPLAKLNRAIKIGNTSNQGEAKSKAFSAIAVTFGEDTKPFEKTNGVFNKNTAA